MCQKIMATVGYSRLENFLTKWAMTALGDLESGLVVLKILKTRDKSCQDLG